MKNNYIRNSHAKFKLKYHFVLCTKYRRKVLSDDIIKCLKSTLDEKLQLYQINIDIAEADIKMRDHIHILVDCPPKISPQKVIKLMKMFTTKKIWEDFSCILKDIGYNSGVLWSSGYFVCSVGNANIKTIMEYIETQG